MRATKLLVFLALFAAAAGCSTDTRSPKCGDANVVCSDGKPTVPGTFESDLPGGASNGLGGPTRGESAGDAAGAPGAGSAPPSAMNPSTPTPTAPNDGNFADDKDGGGAERAIVEADIIQLDGDRLFALSRRAGLAVVNAADPKNLELIGRYRELPGTPFEMYLKGDVAILMFTDWGQYVADEDGQYGWVTTSKVLALDVSNPASIQKLGTFDVPGSISDSRVVGDVLYIAGYESGYCWRCERDKPTTTVSSLNIADTRAIRKVDELRYGNRNDAYSWQRS